MRLLCWNVNSIVTRLPRLLAALQAHRPDVVCLQETKVVDEKFPTAPLAALGYHAVVHGQRCYNGVAILAKQPLTDVCEGFADPTLDAQARLLRARMGELQIVCAYVPNGSQVGSDKFAYKLAWLRRLRQSLVQSHRPQDRLILCGDFNVAPRDSDVAEPESWSQSVLCHPQTRAAFADLLSWGLTDTGAQTFPNGGTYTWWDYRALSFPRNNGLRIDHILCTAPQMTHYKTQTIDRPGRRPSAHPTKPSDHAALIADFN